MELSIEEEIIKPGEKVEVIVKAEPFTTVHLLIASEPLPFDPNGQKLHKDIVGYKMVNTVIPSLLNFLHKFAFKGF